MGVTLMTSSVTARCLALAAILSATVVVAFTAPATAGAFPPACLGINIEGQGSTLQNEAQTVWDAAFCGGGPPTVKYRTTSSSIGMASWGTEGCPPPADFAANNSFIGTDEPPNPFQIANIESCTNPAAKVETIAVAQESVAIIVHLPTGCTATSTPAPGRLVLSDADLEGIFQGTVTTWGALTDGGDKVVGTGCATDAITPVVEFDGSGTTHILKRYLNLVDNAALLAENGEFATWAELAEGINKTVWPAAAHVVRSAPGAPGQDEAEEAKYVVAHAGTIGFVSLVEARKVFVPATPALFWAELQNGTKGSGAHAVPTYQDPATNGDVAAIANANCKKTKYTNLPPGATAPPFGPPATLSAWNEVTSALKEKAYSLCAWTYDLRLTAYPAALQGTTVTEFLELVTSFHHGGGQALILGHDYYSTR